MKGSRQINSDFLLDIGQRTRSCILGYCYTFQVFKNEVDDFEEAEQPPHLKRDLLGDIAFSPRRRGRLGDQRGMGRMPSIKFASGIFGNAILMMIAEIERTQGSDSLGSAFATGIIQWLYLGQ